MCKIVMFVHVFSNRNAGQSRLPLTIAISIYIYYNKIPYHKSNFTLHVELAFLKGIL